MLTEKLVSQFDSDHQLDGHARYHLQAGGKCLRGLLAHTEAIRLGVSEDRAMKWALSCELLHNATLIHDDIQDHDEIRRGQKSLWKKTSVAEAINTGDFLIFRSFRLASELGHPQLISKLSETSEILVRGQSDEINSLKCETKNCWSAYKTMARLKTGALFLLPIEGAHIIASEKLPAATQEIWLQLGLCYQIFDDMRDYLGLKQKGQSKKDFEERRLNALVSYLSLNSKNKNLIDQYIEGADVLHEIEQTIKSQDILNKLETIGNEILRVFRRAVPVETQKVLSRFFESALTLKKEA